MKTFRITVRTATRITSYNALATTAHGAYMNAAEAQGDELCGITVTLAGN